VSLRTLQLGLNSLLHEPDLGRDLYRRGAPSCDLSAFILEWCEYMNKDFESQGILTVKFSKNLL